MGFFGKNLSTGQTIEFQSDQPASLASIVKIFVLAEVMRQTEQGTLVLSESITIERKNKKEICTISDALDKMIGINNNEATDALAAHVGYDGVNALPDQPQYNMTGWGLLIRNEQTTLALCIWCEWFPEQTSGELKRKWCSALSGSIVNILLAQESSTTENKGDLQATIPAETQ